MKTYPKDLPSIGVVLIYLDEALSILKRAMQSIIDRTPKSLLKEIILVDDHSSYGLFLFNKLILTYDRQHYYFYFYYFLLEYIRAGRSSLSLHKIHVKLCPNSHDLFAYLHIKAFIFQNILKISKNMTKKDKD